MLFSFLKQLNAETLAANESVMVEKGNKVFMNVNIHEVNKTSPLKWMNFRTHQFFINTDSYSEGNVFKRYQMDIKCFLKKGTDVVHKDNDRLTLGSNVDITTTEIEVIFENNIKNGAYGKIVQSTTHTAENVNTKENKKLKSGEVLFAKMSAGTVYRLKNNFLLLPEDDKTSVFQNFFHLAKDKRLTTLNLKFKTEDELKNFKTNEKYMGTIIDLDWFKHIADTGFEYAKKQYDLDFKVETQGNVILKGKVDATPSTNAAAVEKSNETTTTEEKKKMGTGLKVFLWLFLIALIAAVAYGAYFLIQRRKKAQMIEEQV